MLGQSHDDAYENIYWEKRAMYVQTHYETQDPAGLLDGVLPGY